jgi:hypothetical protein
MRGRWTQTLESRGAARPAGGLAFGRYARVAVGNPIYHTVGDRESAVRDMVLGYDQLYGELGRAIGVLPYETSAERVKAHPMWFAWWQSVAEPSFSAWARFKSEQLTGDTTGPGGSWIAYSERFTTDWPVYEQWHQRLVDLRAGALQLGIPLASPAPSPLPTTLPEDAKNLAKDLGGDVKDAAKATFDLAKILVYGGLAIGGAVVLTSLTSHARAGSDPLEAWAKLRRG